MNRSQIKADLHACLICPTSIACLGLGRSSVAPQRHRQGLSAESSAFVESVARGATRRQHSSLMADFRARTMGHGRSESLAMGCVRRGLCLLAVLVGMGSALAQDPRPVGTERTLSEAEVKAKYQNCPNGYYSGPRPGKARYTNDNFIWAVTPEFAGKFCMPPEFVSSELKGAEAVAFRIVEDSDEEN